MLWQFIQTVPALMFFAVSNANVNCSEWTDAANPYSVLFARLMASLEVLKGNATTTGPKISSIVTLEAVLTWVIRVGGYHSPALFKFSGMSIWKTSVCTGWRLQKKKWNDEICLVKENNQSCQLRKSNIGPFSCMPPQGFFWALFCRVTE